MSHIKTASFKDIQRALSEHTQELINAIPVQRIQMSMQLGSDKPCVRVSVTSADLDKVPKSVLLKMGSSSVEIPLEAHDDYESFESR